MILRYRRQGLFRRVRRYPFAEGIVCSIDVSVDPGPAAKTIIFETRAAMRSFYEHLQKKNLGIAMGDNLGRKCLGFVNKLLVTSVDPASMETNYHIVDRRYFCLVGLVEGFITQEVLTHESCHVGFAHAFRHGEASDFHDPSMDEEGVCYPAGRWADQVMLAIEQEGIRTHGGDAKRARVNWKRQQQFCRDNDP